MQKKILGKILPLFTLGLALVGVFTLPVKAEETDNSVTYYISSSEGDDKNAGTSEEKPWKTFQNVADLELQGGDRLLLKKGDKWLEQLHLVNPTGTEENPVVVSSYGDGEEKPQLALFEGEVERYCDTPLIYIENGEGLEIKGLDIGFCGVGINLDYLRTYNKKYVRIEDCHFHDIYGFNQVDKGGITKYPHATSIVVTRTLGIPGKQGPALDGLYIHNCTTYDAGALYTYGTSIGGDAGYNVHNLIVTDCVMENNGIYGIAFCGVQGGYMDNCKIIDCGSRYASMGSMGIMCSGQGFTIMNCEIAFQQRLEDNPDGGGIDFEHLTFDVDVINCYIHDNSGVGVMFYQSGGDESHQNKRIRFIANVFENNNQNVYKPGGSELISVPMTSLVDGMLINNRYMTSENLFALYMHNTVMVEGNAAYSQEQQGQVWPLLDFDDVRAYVLEGKPLPGVEDQYVADEEVQAQTIAFYEKESYLIGFGIGAAGCVVLMGIGIVVRIIVKNTKKRGASSEA